MMLEVIETGEQSLTRSLDKYLSSAAGTPPEVRLIARSPNSPLAQAVWQRLAQLTDRGCTVEMVLGVDDLTRPETVAPCLSAARLPGVSLRVARFAGRGELVEQLGFGDSLWECGAYGIRPLPASSGALRIAATSFRALAAASDTIH